MSPARTGFADNLPAMRISIALIIRTATFSGQGQAPTNMKDRQRVSTGTKWEPLIGYSRAVRVGDRIYVTGTTATDERGEIVGVGDAYAQAAQAIKNIERSLARLGAGLEHVVRTRMFVTDISRWEEYGRAHGEFFRDVMPATSMIEISRLIDERMLIEIEADAEV
jgi:enamine deaminase RidA (YjgF/YER057c/UK114 family)